MAWCWLSQHSICDIASEGKKNRFQMLFSSRYKCVRRIPISLSPTTNLILNTHKKWGTKKDKRKRRKHGDTRKVPKISFVSMWWYMKKRTCTHQTKLPPPSFPHSLIHTFTAHYPSSGDFDCLSSRSRFEKFPSISNRKGSLKRTGKHYVSLKWDGSGKTASTKNKKRGEACSEHAK